MNVLIHMGHLKKEVKPWVKNEKLWKVDSLINVEEMAEEMGTKAIG